MRDLELGDKVRFIRDFQGSTLRRISELIGPKAGDIGVISNVDYTGHPSFGIEVEGKLSSFSLGLWWVNCSGSYFFEQYVELIED